MAYTYKRKYNKISMVEIVKPYGYWNVHVISPSGEHYHKIYMGCTKREAVSLARKYDFDGETIRTHTAEIAEKRVMS